VGNYWYDAVNNNVFYCAQDSTVSGVGTVSAAGKMSPAPLLATTITDQLKLATNQQAKVIGVALKDRGAILPAGHAADAAYWFDGYTNAWVSSTWYMSQLPEWVQTFNAEKKANAYMANEWNLALPAADYRNSTADNVPWEMNREGESWPVFPHITSTASSMESVKATPFGNSLTIDIAEAAVLGEGLGRDYITDFLCVSFSSTDYIGHGYGPYSMEVEDTYIRLDRDLGDFLQFLDTEVGSGNYLIFLTSDHGVAPTPGYMESMHIPAGLFDDIQLVASIDTLLDLEIAPADWIRSFQNQQLYLNHSVIDSLHISVSQVADIIHKWAMKQPGIAQVEAVSHIPVSNITASYREMFINGIYPKRSGDILIVFEPNWFDYGPTGSSHGSNYSYDTHVPLLWYGWKIQNGKSWKRYAITDIAPTIAAMLRIAQPSGSIGAVIDEMK
jgi:arylsulfatase A-like enzyme